MSDELIRQSAFTGGELDPLASARRDLKAYYASVELGENMVCLPQGPIAGRDGFEHVALVRNKLAAVSLETASLTAPNGGTPAGAVSGAGMSTTTAMETTDPYVVLEIDFGQPVEVALVDLTNYGTGTGTGGGVIAPPDYPWWKDELGNLNIGGF